MRQVFAAVHESVHGTFRTLLDVRCLVATGGKPDIADVRSQRLFGSDAFLLRR
jgi:hypothetical protein